jgi:glutamate carboxypeptidase
MSAIDLTAYFTPLIPESICRLRQLVEMESHSADKGAVDALAAHLAGMFEAAGGTAELLSCPSHGNTLRVSWGAGTKANAGPVLLLGHLDTVWPQGTTRVRPFRVENEKAFGPGVYDMKAGLLLSWLVARALQNGASRPGRDVLFLFTGDEEIGTAEGLPHLKQAARGCAAVLCLEPPLAGGKAKTFRKGVGCFRLQVTGLSAHAGVEPEKGANAILELSRQVLRLHELNDRERGTTVTVGVIKGGTASNVVPSEAEAEIDVRVASAEEGSSIEARISALKPHDPRCELRVEGGMNRPPLERTPAVAELYLKARSAALELGMELGEGGTGGGSDGSFTAAMGIPTLDGLGVEGGGAHAPHEYIEIGDIPKRAALLCRLLETIG